MEDFMMNIVFLVIIAVGFKKLKPSNKRKTKTKRGSRPRKQTRRRQPAKHKRAAQ